MNHYYSYHSYCVDEPDQEVRKLFLSWDKLIEYCPWLKRFAPPGLNFHLELTQDNTHLSIEEITQWYT
jgi:hypothetical protein